MFVSTAYAAGNGSPAGGLGGLLPLILIFGIFYFLLIRPQQKKQKQHVQMIDSLKAGDTVVTQGGMYGKIERVLDDSTFIVEIDQNVKVKLAKNAVAAKIEPSANLSANKEEK